MVGATSALPEAKEAAAIGPRGSGLGSRSRPAGVVAGSGGRRPIGKRKPSGADGKLMRPILLDGNWNLIDTGPCGREYEQWLDKQKLSTDPYKDILVKIYPPRNPPPGEMRQSYRADAADDELERYLANGWTLEPAKA